MQAVCNVFLNRFTSNVYNSIIDVILDDTESQKRLDAMVGNYNGYWPGRTEGTFSKWPMRIERNDGIYTVSSTTGDSEYKYDHHGFAFLIRNRVHVVEVRKNGIRSMLFHFEELPARNPVSGIIMNVLRTDDTAPDRSEKLFAVHFLAIHEKNPKYNRAISDQEIASLLSHPLNRTGVIRK